MAAAREQLGGDLINLASGDPDLPTPAYITAAAVTAIEDGQHHYTPKNGLPALRDAISFHLERTIGMTYRPDEICATAGVQEAMISCFLALTAAGQFPACRPPQFSLSFRSDFAQICSHFQSSSGFTEQVDKLSLTIRETAVVTSEAPKLSYQHTNDSVNIAGFSFENTERACENFPF